MISQIHVNFGLK